MVLILIMGVVDAARHAQERLPDVFGVSRGKATGSDPGGILLDRFDHLKMSGMSRPERGNGQRKNMKVRTIVVILLVLAVIGLACGIALTCFCCSGVRTPSWRDAPSVDVQGMLDSLVRGSKAEDHEEGPSNMLGSLVKKILARFDSSKLGVKTSSASLKIVAKNGTIEIQDLFLYNPDGYVSDYLLRVKKVHITIDMKALVRSLGKKLEVKVLEVEGLEVIYETHLCSSNLNDLLNYMSGKDKPKEASPKKGASHGNNTSKDNSQHLVLHKVLAKNVECKQSSLCCCGLGPRLEVGDIAYKDFKEEFGGARDMAAIVRILLETLIKSVLATVVGKEKAHRTLSAVKDYPKTMVDGIGHAAD